VRKSLAATINILTIMLHGFFGKGRASYPVDTE
jgi:hypothetical protein